MSHTHMHNTGKAYWRSINDLTDSPALRDAAGMEFVDYAPTDVLRSPTRRSLLKLMGASLALAGAGSLGGCRRWPVRKLAPYADLAEDRIPGVPEQFASVFDLGGSARPVLVSSFEGRPVKIEGNPSHPLCAGAADAITQASVLEVWDPGRSRAVLKDGKPSTWDEFLKVAAELRKSGGAGTAIISGFTSSPTSMELRSKLKAAMPSAAWVEYEPVNRDNEIAGAALAFGKPVRTHYQLDNADVIVVLDADPLGAHPAQLKHARDWAAGRRPSESRKFSRLYVAEPGLTVTGTNADIRIPMKRSAIASLAAAIERTVFKTPNKLDAQVQTLADDLVAAKSRGLVVVGEGQPPEVHAAAHRINAQLGAVGATVVYTDEPAAGKATDAIASLAGRKFDTMIILGGNPVYDAPIDVDFESLLKNAKTSIHLGAYVDETAAGCTWHIPAAHYLEAWGDARSWDGVLSIQQPLIQPLWGGKSEIELLATLAGDSVLDGHELVRRTWASQLPAASFEKAWRKALHDGLLAGSAWTPVRVTAAAGALGDLKAGDGLELCFAPDYKVYDGRFANNGWLQEMPDPVTKLTWDNAAMIGASTAAKLGLKHGDTIRLSTDKGKIKAAVFILPGVAPDTICMSLGYGRSKAEYIGQDVGFEVRSIRTVAASKVGWVKVELAKLGGSYHLATTQDHHMIDDVGMKERESRAPMLIRSLEAVKHAELAKGDGHALRHFIEHKGVHHPKEHGSHLPLQLWQEPVDYSVGYRWGLSIDLNACIGCGACMVACQAENNIPVVGKEYVLRGREMHWIRVDRYFTGDLDNPRAVHQPMTCHQCENAPCESVCPVAATVHDTEGINVMVYNRCVGTRYCANNCPYKVRRFNYFDWHYKPVKSGDLGGFYPGIPDQQQGEIDPVRKLGFNPDVTVRMRGVMEKCTFCTQRIKAKTIPAKNQAPDGKPRLPDGAIVTACQQTCPTQAITFGDLNDKNSRVAQLASDARSYLVLEELNVRPRVNYLARVTNSGKAEADPHHSDPKPAHGAEGKHG